MYLVTRRRVATATPARASGRRLRAASGLQRAAGVKLASLLSGIDGVASRSRARASSRSPRCATTRARSSRAIVRGGARADRRRHATTRRAASDAGARRGGRSSATARVAFSGRAVRGGVERAQALGRSSRATASGGPAEALTLIGVTGTNGKTTTTYLVEAMLRAAGRRAGRGRHGRPIAIAAARGRRRYTTPTPLELHATLRRDARGGLHARRDGVLVARARARAARGLRFRGGGVHQPDPGPSRFSRHDGGLSRRQGDACSPSMLAPAATRCTFDRSRDGARMARAARGRRCCASRRAGRGGPTSGVERSTRRRRHRARSSRRRGARSRSRTPLVGDYNLENLAVAVGIGVGARAARRGDRARRSRRRGVPGRLERVPTTRTSLCSSTTRTRRTRSSA